MKTPKIFFLILVFLLSMAGFSQAPMLQNQDKVSTAITNYFKLDRENIHLHLNKNQFLTTDKIWLKGYITEKKTGLPYDPTSNVFVTLLDENGLKIKSFLFYAENSTFEGSIPLDPKYKTGKYYLQVFTNYMNNFSEDESSVYKIYILNPSENKKITTTEINYASVGMNFSPESGVLLEGVINTVAIQVKDCNNNGVAVKDGTVYDSKGTVITTFSTNAFGYGKFDIVMKHNETYKAIIKLNEKTIEKTLPQPTLNGITFSVNSFTFSDKAILKIKTNERTLASVNNERHSIVVQKNNSASYLEFSFDNKTEKTISIPTELFSGGVNTIYLLDKNLSKIGERVIYKQQYTNSKTDLQVALSANDSIHINGITSLPLAEMSISVLPENALYDNGSQNIYNAKVFSDLKQNIPGGAYFLSDFNRNKHFELDNILITSQSKYDWKAILYTLPKENYEFDNGLNIRGKINTELSNKADYKVNLTSLVFGINEFTSITDTNEFYFKNLYATDSTKIHFSLLNKKGKMDEMKMACSITNNKRNFNKRFTSESTLCPTIFKDIKSNEDGFFPQIANTTLLDSISVTGAKKKPALTNSQRFGNGMSKGYKISEKDATSFRDVLQFIASHGYDVSTEAGNVIIVGRVATSFLGTKSPAVFMDDVPVSDFNLLLNYSLIYIDEIYVNKRGYGGGMNASNGVIRIYTKKGIDAVRSSTRIKSGSIVVEDGFQPWTEFVTPKYTSFRDNGFQAYGTINWIPKVATDTNGTFKFAIPNLYQAKVKVIIEGISSDGQIICEIKTLEIPQ